MPTPSFPIQGVTPRDGGVAPRQEIDSWYHDPKNARQVALFVLALKNFKELDPLGKDGKDPKLSYYQIAGLRRARSTGTVYPANYPQEFTENLGSHGTVLLALQMGK